MEKPKSENQPAETEANKDSKPTEQENKQKAVVDMQAPDITNPADKIDEQDFIINPNKFVNTTGKEIDYQKLIAHFGCHGVDETLKTKFEAVTGQTMHHMLRRDIFFAHRDFHVFLKAVEDKKPVYLYTGRGPSTDSMHLGHLLPFIFCKYLQDVFGCPMVIQITDDEKYFYQPQQSEKFKPKDLNWFSEIALENIKDIIACGFDESKTFIFRDCDYIGTMYPNICRMQRHITYSQVKGIFGFDGSENTGKVAYPAIQAVPCMSSTFPHIFGDKNNAVCLIPCGIDQDPYFRMTRDIAQRMKFPKPTGIYSKFFPALQGFDGKMSSSIPNSAIFLTDTPAQIKNKINKYAFSGGKVTLEEHRKYGADIDVDVSYNYLRFFLEDDAKLDDIGKKYKSGEMLTSEVKSVLIDILQKVVGDHQAARKNVSMEMVHRFMKIRPIK